MTEIDLVKRWKEAARRDDLFNHMVPSDVRQLVGEIERLRTERDDYKADYIRRHKEASDRFEECIQLRRQLSRSESNLQEMITNRKIHEG